MQPVNTAYPSSVDDSNAWITRAHSVLVKHVAPSAKPRSTMRRQEAALASLREKCTALAPDMRRSLSEVSTLDEKIAAAQDEARAIVAAAQNGDAYSNVDAAAQRVATLGESAVQCGERRAEVVTGMLGALDELQFAIDSGILRGTGSSRRANVAVASTGNIRMAAAENSSSPAKEILGQRQLQNSKRTTASVTGRKVRTIMDMKQLPRLKRLRQNYKKMTQSSTEQRQNLSLLWRCLRSSLLPMPRQ
jgi:hypothetical protein